MPARLKRIKRSCGYATRSGKILWSHLQIEDGLVSRGEAHHAIPGALLDTLKNERQEMRKLIATLRELSSGWIASKPHAAALPSRKRCWPWRGPRLTRRAL